MKTHGIVIDKSVKDNELFKSLKILGKITSSSNQWILHKIDFSQQTKELEKKLQTSLKEKFYFHYYNDKKIVVVFPKKVFEANHNTNSWKEFIEYGLSIGIPKEQLNLKPSNFEEETY